MLKCCERQYNQHHRHPRHLQRAESAENEEGIETDGFEQGRCQLCDHQISDPVGHCGEPQRQGAPPDKVSHGAKVWRSFVPVIRTNLIGKISPQKTQATGPQP